MHSHVLFVSRRFENKKFGLILEQKRFSNSYLTKLIAGYAALHYFERENWIL